MVSQVESASFAFALFYLFLKNMRSVKERKISTIQYIYRGMRESIKPYRLYLRQFPTPSLSRLDEFLLSFAHVAAEDFSQSPWLPELSNSPTRSPIFDPNCCSFSPNSWKLQHQNVNLGPKITLPTWYPGLFPPLKECLEPRSDLRLTLADRGSLCLLLPTDWIFESCIKLYPSTST